MAGPARQRILDAAAGLARARGIGRLTTREIAVAAQVAEGSVFKNFEDKAGLLTELLSSELPENRAGQAQIAAVPPGPRRPGRRSGAVYRTGH
jgi:AcrR family transcriptional regulator